MLKGRVIDPKIVRESWMKELVEKLKFQKWTHIFIGAVPVNNEEEVCQFYSNFQLLENNTMSTTVKGVEVTFNDEKLIQILRVPTNEFDTYVKYNWLKIE